MPKAPKPCNSTFTILEVTANGKERTRCNRCGWTSLNDPYRNLRHKQTGKLHPMTLAMIRKQMDYRNNCGLYGHCPVCAAKAKARK